MKHETTNLGRMLKHLLDDDDDELIVFRDRLVCLLETVREAEGMEKMAYAAYVMSFATICLSEELIWHVVDHDGTDCATEGLEETLTKFNATVRVHVGRLAEKKGVKNPFEELDVNSTTAQEIMDTLRKEEASSQ